MKRILLGLTGSVASTLAIKMIEQLQKIGIVDVVRTKHSKYFIDTGEVSIVVRNGGGKMYEDSDEWFWMENVKAHTFDSKFVFGNKYKKGNNILHIDLRNQADVFVIAPCSMNTLAKLANGICDNLLTSIARAWDFNKPIIIAPACNVMMWEHPITGRQIDSLITYGYGIINPIEKELACGDFGMGAMANIQDIVDAVKNSLKWTFPICNYRIGIPIGDHPGAFKATRKNSIHTGIDLYVEEGTRIYPVETGIVIGIFPFTGTKTDSPWWNDTDCVLIEGPSGVICYGEINPIVNVGHIVFTNTTIGTVMRVIKEGHEHYEIESWKPSMLHLELYPHGTREPSNGYEKYKDTLLDPTQYLIDSIGAPKTFLTNNKKQ